MEFRQAVAETGPFGRRCLSILPCSPFPLPAHQTGRADFPHPAFRSGFNVTPSAEPSSHIQTGLAVPHAILVARPLANRRAFQPFHRRPESEAPSLYGRYPLPRYYGPLRHPMPPGLALTGFRLNSRPSHRASRVDAPLLCTHAIANTPVFLCGALIARFPQRRRPSLVWYQLGIHIALFEAYSAFTHIMACALADRLFSDLLHRRASPVAVAHYERSGCYRLERQLPGGLSSSHWSCAPFSRRTPKRTLDPRIFLPTATKADLSY